ncbi:MAG: response regulator [Eubacteriales bacterium]|nr:response regulator [Eubacteriales bacterium]
MKKERKLFLTIIGVISLAFALIMIFFTVRNNKRIINYNLNYLSDNTARAAVAIDDEIVIGYENIKVLSGLVGKSLTGPEFDISEVQDLITNSVFDFMEFADKDGMDHNITGGVSDARDRQYYLDAKEGNTGMELIYNSRATHETLLMFYSPIYYEDEFVGSLVGVYQAANRITGFLSEKYFGDSADAYLLEADGRIIASTVDYDPTKETYLRDIAGNNSFVMKQLEAAMASGETTAISFPENSVGGVIAKLPNSGYYMLRLFPQKAHERVVSRSNSLVNIVVLLMVALFAVLLTILTYFYHQEQKVIEAARKEAEDANSAKTTFLFNMSHDIRTPMNAIIGFRDLLEKHQDDPEKRAGYLKKIDDASTVLLSIINNVLEMARIEKGTLEVDETAWSAEQFNDTLYSIFFDMMKQKGIEFTRKIDVKNHYVYCDPIKLREVFTNILSNAYKYTEPGGKVHMLLEEIPSEREGYASYRTTITDTGIGMSEDFLPHLFEEFARENNSTDSKVEGTGLGMPIVKRLVELMDGTVEVKSKKGEGTEFIVVLSHKIADKSSLIDHEGVEVDPRMFMGKRILLAEDNDLNAEIAMEILTEAGFVVDRAEDGVRCVEMVKNAKTDYYDLILMDIQMPNMNGYEATKAIRSMDEKDKAEIRIIAMTANAFEEDKREAMRVGMNGHIAKPINIKSMFRLLTTVLITPKNQTVN